MIFFECPKCESRFSSGVVSEKEDFERYGNADRNKVQEGCYLRCPKCQTVYKIHLEKVGK
jgi:uncharacterized C2H2 Zn-finger protein